MERLNERLVREWHESAGEKVRAERRFSLGAIQDFAEWMLARTAIATEAGTAETAQHGSVHEGAGRQASPNPPRQPKKDRDNVQR